MRHVPSAVRGQSLAEYTVLAAMVALAMAGISTYLRRGLQGHIRWEIDRTLPVATKVAERPQECIDAGVGKTAATLSHCTQFYGTQDPNEEELKRLPDFDPAKPVAVTTTKVGQTQGGKRRSLKVQGAGGITRLTNTDSGDPVVREGTSVSVGRSGSAPNFVIRPKLPGEQN